MNRSEQSRVFGLDAMRCAAISLVVLGHGSAFLTTQQASHLRGLLWDNAFLGVEIFFVRSGFLIGGILLKISERGVSLVAIRDFWLRRWFRTLPNYYLFLLVSLVGFTLLKPGFTFDWKFIFFLQNFAWENERFFSVSWSLAVEEWFYLLLPLCILLGVTFLSERKHRVLYALLAFLVMTVTIRLAYVLAVDPKWNGAIRLAVVFRLDSLLFGVLTAYIGRYHAIVFAELRHCGLLLGSLIVLAAVLLKNSSYIETSVLARTMLFPLFSIGFALYLPFCASLSMKEGRLRKSVESISLWSYSLYLIHVVVLDIFLIMRDRLHASSSLMVDGILFVLWIVLCVAASGLIYRYFEKPLTNLRDSVTRSHVSTEQLSSNAAISRSVP